jgi:uncharacterized membrane protein YhaH (DUF805 family)
MVVALCLAFVSATAVTAGQYEDGVAAMRRGDYATATRLLVPLANQGDARAQFSLSQLPGFQSGRPLSSQYGTPSRSPSNSSSDGFAAVAILFAAIALVALVCVGIAVGARRAQAQFATSTGAPQPSAASSTSLFSRKTSLTRKEFWIRMAWLLPAKFALTFVALLMLTSTKTSGPFGAMDTMIAVFIAITIGARFHDIGWRRWLGVLLTLVLMLGLPIVTLIAVAMSNSLPHGANPFDVWYVGTPSTIGLLVLIVVAGSWPSRKLSAADEGVVLAATNA